MTRSRIALDSSFARFLYYYYYYYYYYHHHYLYYVYLKLEVIVGLLL